MMTTVDRWRVSWVPVAVVVLSFALRLLAAMVQPLNLDEGSYLLEADLLRSGQVPFRDYVAREPIFILLVAAFRALFGEGYLAGRLLVVVAGAATTGLIYLLGTRLFDRSAGLLGAAVHAFTPYFIYGGTILKLEPVAVATTTAAMLVAANADSRKVSSAILAGLLIGLSVHVRRNVIILLPVVAMLAWLRAGRARPVAFLCLAAGLVAAAIPLVGASLLTDPRWIWNVYGRAYRDNQPLESKLAVLRSAIMFLTPHIALATAFLITELRRWLNPRAVGLIVLFSLFGWAALLGVGWTSSAFGFGVLWTPQWQRVLAAAALGFSIVFIATRVGPDSSVSQLALGRESDIIVRLWLGVIAGFYAMYIHIFVDYLMDLSAVISLATARMWLWLTHERISDDRRAGAPGRAILAALLLLLPSVYFLPLLNPYNRPVAAGLPQYNLYERTYPPDLVNQVSAAIRTACPSWSNVLTGDPVFAATAGRRVFHNITYPILYFQDRPRPFDYDPFNLAPTGEMLALRAFNQQVPCVVVGERTRKWFEWSPALKRLLAMGYAPLASFGSPDSVSHVELYVRRALLSNLKSKSDSRPELSEFQGKWESRGSWFGVSEGRAQRALALSRKSLDYGTRVSARVWVRGEGGFVFGYTRPEAYVGVRFISSPDVTGLNVFIVTRDGERSLADVPFAWFKERPVYLVVYAFPTLLEVLVEGRRFVLIDLPLNAVGRVGLLANYGAWFSEVRFDQDVPSLLGSSQSGSRR